jgi:orotidine-5'-phosphate decarboxylase
MIDIPLEERVIVALDVPTLDEARAVVEELDGVLSFFKIGLQLQVVGGTELVRWLVDAGKRVFLDYKYHDVETTVREGVRRVTELGVSLLTVHGYRHVMEAAVEGRGDGELKIMAVTVLTSLSEADVREMGIQLSVADLVRSRAERAVEAGCDGVIASGQEAAAIRSLAPRDFLIVTPGIRPAGSERNEQQRAVTPKYAIVAGADYLVVGRPILRADDRACAARKIVAEVAAALDVL